MLESLAHDVRYAARSLIRQPGVTVLAVGILALGLGLNAAVLAVAYGVLWRPLPYPAADRLVTISEVDQRDGRESAVWLGRIDEWNRRLRTVRMAGYLTRERVVRGAGPTRVRAVATVTEGFFEVLAVPAVAGAVPRLAVGDGRAVVSAELARAVEDQTGRPAVGQAMTIGDGRYDVVAVMPAGFGFPSAEVDAWVADQPDFRGERGAVGRMGDGVSLAQVRDDAARVAREDLAARGVPGVDRWGAAVARSRRCCLATSGPCCGCRWRRPCSCSSWRARTRRPSSSGARLPAGGSSPSASPSARDWPAWSGPRCLRVWPWPRAGSCWASWQPGSVCKCSQRRLPACRASVPSPSIRRSCSPASS